MHCQQTFPLNGTGGRDDAKLTIPATVILRFMFTPAEMRVSVEHSVLFAGHPVSVWSPVDTS